MASLSDLSPKSRDDCRVDISELLPTDESEDIFQHSHQGVCVCKVPRSLKAAKPEAFIPHFVGLGPYHHDRPDLILTDTLKLGAANRVLQLPRGVLQHLFDVFNPDTDIRGYYHVDVDPKHPDPKLLRMLLFDALFLLGLLELIRIFATRSDNPQEHTHTYYWSGLEQYCNNFLTGKHGMPLLNYAGVELTMDAIIRDVFMLENQIPTHFLKQIARFHAGEVYDQDLGSTMKRFCEKFCPFEAPEELSKGIEAHHHLLDLMYHLTSPESEPKSKSESESKSEPESKPPSQAQEPINKCCYVCWGILVILVVVCFVLGLIVKLVVKLVSWIVGLIVKFLVFIRPMVEGLCNAQIPGTKKFTPVVDQIKKITDELGSTKRDHKDARPIVMIQSVTELHSAGIKFLPTQGGISTIHFNVTECQFYLPTIKVDVNSEVIFRNLVAYEVLTKSECLIFTRYIEMMRAIIDTPEDVKLLVQKGIIRTELTDEVVEQLFNGMSKSIRPTKTPVLDGVIHDVKAKFESTRGLNRVAKYVYSSWKFITAIAALVFLVLQAVQAYCSVFGCSRTSKSALLPEYRDYAGNNIFKSSM